MQTFRFRAAGALDLRKRQEDEARLALTRAQNVAALAESRLDLARTRLGEAQLRFVQVQSQGAPVWLIGWHRSWIVSRSREADACHRAWVSAAAAVTDASAVVRDAHQRRRALERLRDRLAARHARAVERHDLRQMNELAGLRYLAAAAERKEPS